MKILSLGILTRSRDASRQGLQCLMNSVQEHSHLGVGLVLNQIQFTVIMNLNPCAS